MELSRTFTSIFSLKERAESEASVVMTLERRAESWEWENCGGKFPREEETPVKDPVMDLLVVVKRVRLSSFGAKSDFFCPAPKNRHVVQQNIERP